MENKLKEDDNLIDDLKVLLKNRLGNPMILSYLIGFVLCNWEAIAFFILATDRTIEQRISGAKELSNWITLILLPMLSTFFYVILLPYISLAFEKLLVKYNTW